jgi:pimeloyl-ACP methyl ester carboxylesterase
MAVEKSEEKTIVTPHGVELCYDAFGDSQDRALVLIIGLATQMIFWPDTFCRMLAEAGHYVIRFDNRDNGRSAKMEHLGIPDLEKLMSNARKGRDLHVPYTLSDMAEDTIGLMDALQVERAHVCGMSMGGMIGQIMALEHPDRLSGLISMLSTTGENDLPESTPAAREAMMSSPPNTRAEYQTYIANICRAFADGSPFYDEPLQRELAGQAFDRGLYPEGFFRQMAAIIAAEGRRQALRKVRAPALVIHGDCDTVIPLAHGEDTARAIPGARLRVIPGLGHGPAFPELWGGIVDSIEKFTAGGS